MLKHNVYFYSSAFAAALLLAFISALLWFSPHIPFWKNYLIAINLSSFCIMGTDKFLAKLQKKRIPEVLIYAHALLGGSIGTLIAMLNFRHKTSKRRFITHLGCIVLLQLTAYLLLDLE